MGTADEHGTETIFHQLGHPVKPRSSSTGLLWFAMGEPNATLRSTFTFLAADFTLPGPYEAL